MYDSYQNMTWRFGGRGLTDTVKKLLIANGVVFILQFLTLHRIDYILALVPRFALFRLFLWQFFTYMFLHASILHIGFNMYLLWIFGCEVERIWGPRTFLKYYIITGVGAGVFHTLISLVTSSWMVPTIGASGAVFGVMVAYAMMFPERRIMLLFPPVVLPVRTLVLIYIGIELLIGYGSISGSVQDRVAHFAHLGGALVGYLYLKQDWRWGYFTGEISKWFKGKKMRVVRNVKKDNIKDINELKHVVDELLDKANEVGIDNLTREEKNLLKKASKILNKEGQ